MIPIVYVEGDATIPNTDNHAMIVHICNDLGRWGKGFVLALSKRWPECRHQYLKAFKSKTPPELGDVQFIHVTNKITVANLIGQHGIQTRSTNRLPPPIRYPAVEQGLNTIAEQILIQHCSVHMPRIGCGLAGGQWSEIEPLIQRCLSEKGIAVTVYDFSP